MPLAQLLAQQIAALDRRRLTQASAALAHAAKGIQATLAGVEGASPQRIS
jgi:hypothetical protein